MRRQKKRKLRIYFAGPLFTEDEKKQNLETTRALEKLGYLVFLPQRDGILLADRVAWGEKPEVVRQEIFKGDVSALRDADIVIAVLNGADVDSGTAAELGMFYILGHGPCIGLQTDPRRLLPTGNNPMIDGMLSQYFTTVEGLLEWASNFIDQAGGDGR